MFAGGAVGPLAVFLAMAACGTVHAACMAGCAAICAAAPV